MRECTACLQFSDDLARCRLRVSRVAVQIWRRKVHAAVVGGLLHTRIVRLRIGNSHAARGTSNGMLLD